MLKGLMAPFGLHNRSLCSR